MLFLPLPFQQCGRVRNRGCGQLIVLHLCQLLFLLFPMWSLPWDTVLHKVNLFHRMFFKSFSSMGSYCGVQPFRNTLSSTDPLQSHICQKPQSFVSCSLFRACLPAATWVSSVTAGGSLLHMDLHGFQGQSCAILCSGTSSTSSCSFFTDLDVCRTSLSHFLPLLSQMLLCFFYHSLNTLFRGETNIMD